MKKETVKTFVILVLVILVVFLSVKSMKYYQKSQDKPETKTITVTDTLTQVMYDTIFINHFETVKLPVVDTIVIDSLRIDSVFVEIPISIYKFDTTFCNDTTRLDLFIQNKGFNVTLDSLSYRLEYTPTPIKLPKKNYFREHFKFGAGIGTGFGVFSKKTDIFLGAGFYYCF